MTNTEYLIVGQGICGTLLSWQLSKLNASFVVIDEADPSSSSRVAAGVINPVTGRRIVKTWMIDTLLPFAKTAYGELAETLGGETIAERSIVDFFPSPQMRNAFSERLLDHDPYLSFPSSEKKFEGEFNYLFGYGEIKPAYVVQLSFVLTKWREKLGDLNALREEHFDPTHLALVDDTVHYKDIRANKIIFCNGTGAGDLPWFRNLPFAFNKGEALIIRASLPQQHVYKKALTLAPLAHDYFWVGSSHDWDFTDALPTPEFLEKTKKQLQHWLKIPFSVEGHVAAIRPATVERRPFVGMHPHITQIGILNGMGTKGCSLAPYFAHQLAMHLTSGKTILPEANINRFTRILQAFN